MIWFIIILLFIFVRQIARRTKASEKKATHENEHAKNIKIEITNYNTN